MFDILDGRGQFKCDGTRAETRFRLSAKRTNPFKSAGGRQFSRLLATEVCASAVVMLDTPCSEVVWRVLATHYIRQFPLHFPSRASPCAITFQLESTSEYTARRISRVSMQQSVVKWDQCHLPVLSAMICLLTAYRWYALHLNRGPVMHEKSGEFPRRFFLPHSQNCERRVLAARLPLDGFSWSLIFEYFLWKSVDENLSFFLISQEKRVLCIKTSIHFWSYLAPFFLNWEIFRAKFVEKIKTHFFVQ